MFSVVDHPFVFVALAFAGQCAAAYFGDLIRNRVRPLAPKERKDLDIVLTAILTLLALLIGFSFSMAVSRYDQRKTFEAAEANAISTEYMRAAMLADPARSQVRDLLGRYVDQRVESYRVMTVGTGAADTDLLELQGQLWSAVSDAAAAQPNPLTQLAVSGMNDVFNTRGSAKAAWLNRIPTTAWVLLVVTAVFVNLLLGYRERRTDPLVLFALPLAISISLFLIADIDSPRAGLIRVTPANLLHLSETLHLR